jgi:hypothetical protein
MNHPNIANLFRCSDAETLKNPTDAYESPNEPFDPLAKEAFKLDSFLVDSKYALKLDELI